MQYDLGAIDKPLEAIQTPHRSGLAAHDDQSVCPKCNCSVWLQLEPNTRRY